MKKICSILIALESLTAAQSLAQQQQRQPRAMPGANTLPRTVPYSGGPTSKPLASDAYASNLKVGDYVELDSSIRNEMYGTIDFPNADLKDIIKAISKLSGKNFILDRKIEGRKITIISPTPVTKQEAYNAFLSALYMNGFTLVSMGNFLKIVDAKEALQSNIRVFMGDYAPASEEIVTVLYPLKYLNADEIARYLTDLIPRNGRISPYPNTNTLVMTDTGLNLRRIIAILKSIDIQGHEDQLETIPIRYASAKGIASLIDDILEAQNGRRGPGAPGVRSAVQKTRGGGIITKIVPDERTNSLVVLANGRGVVELKDLVSKLDTPNAAGGGNIHIYYCKNAVADELASTINALISGTQSNRPQGAPSIFNPLPPPGGAFFPGVRSSSTDGVKLEGNIKVTADKATNSLVIVASGSDFTALKSVLRKLDIPRRQVYVEATIMEVKAGDTSDFGVATNIATSGIAQVGGFVPSNITIKDFYSAITTPAGISGLVGAISTGHKWDVSGPSGNFRIGTVSALIKAIVNTNQGQVLHQPQVLTSDNQEAEIKVTLKVPYATSTVTYNANGVAVPSTNTSTSDVDVSLKITPQLGVGNDLVKLKVDQSIADFSMKDLVVNGQNAGQSPEITTRKATTTVVVRDDDTVVIGGLQKTNSLDNRSKYPILGDLPIIGWLFKGSHAESTRSNLILFLKPKIINEYNDILRVTGQKIDAREKFGHTITEPADRSVGKVAELKKTNQADLAKAPPKGWGFKPRGAGDEDVDDDISPSDESELDKPETNLDRRAKGSKNNEEASAYIDPNNFHGSGVPPVETPPALKNDKNETTAFDMPATTNTNAANTSGTMELTPPANAGTNAPAAPTTPSTAGGNNAAPANPSAR